MQEISSSAKTIFLKIEKKNFQVEFALQKGN